MAPGKSLSTYNKLYAVRGDTHPRQNCTFLLLLCQVDGYTVFGEKNKQNRVLVIVSGCQTKTFESLDIGSPCLHIQCVMCNKRLLTYLLTYLQETSQVRI